MGRRARSAHRAGRLLARRVRSSAITNYFPIKMIPSRFEHTHSERSGHAEQWPAVVKVHAQGLGWAGRQATAPHSAALGRTRRINQRSPADATDAALS